MAPKIRGVPGPNPHKAREPYPYQRVQQHPGMGPRTLGHRTTPTQNPAILKTGTTMTSADTPLEITETQLKVLLTQSLSNMIDTHGDKKKTREYEVWKNTSEGLLALYQQQRKPQ